MPGAVGIDLVPTVNPAEWQATIAALSAQAAASFATAGAISGQAFQQGFAHSAIGPGSFVGTPGLPGHTLGTPRPAFHAPGGFGPLGTSSYVLPPVGARGPSSPLLPGQPAYSVGPSPTTTPGGRLRGPGGQFVGPSYIPPITPITSYRPPFDAYLHGEQMYSRSGGTDYVDRRTGYRGPFGGPYSPGSNLPVPYTGQYAGRGGFATQNIPSSYLYDADARFAETYRGGGPVNIARYDPVFAAQQAAAYAAGRAIPQYFDDYDRLASQGFDISSGETEEDFVRRRIRDREEKVKSTRRRIRGGRGEGRGLRGLFSFGTGGDGGGYNVTRSQRKLGDFILGSATGLPRALRGTALGTGFTARFGGALGFAGLAVGAGLGGSALAFNRFRKGYTDEQGYKRLGDTGAAEALEELGTAASGLANVLASEMGPIITEVVTGLTGMVEGIARFLGVLNEPNEPGLLDDLKKFGAEFALNLIPIYGQIRAVSSIIDYGNYVVTGETPATYETQFGRFDWATRSGEWGVERREVVREITENLREGEARYTSLLADRLQIERALTDQMHAELAARLNLTQHLAQEALDVPTERLGLNEAIANLRNFAGTPALTHGTLLQRDALRGVLDVAGGFSGLEGQSLAALSAAARRSGESTRSYIRNFIQSTTGFEISNKHLNLITQQIGAAGATERQEDLALRREQLNLMRTNNDNLDALSINMEAMVEALAFLSDFAGIDNVGLIAEYEDPSPLFDNSLTLEADERGEGLKTISPAADRAQRATQRLPGLSAPRGPG